MNQNKTSSVTFHRPLQKPGKFPSPTIPALSKTPKTSISTKTQGSNKNILFVVSNRDGDKMNKRRQVRTWNEISLSLQPCTCQNQLQCSAIQKTKSQRTKRYSIAYLQSLINKCQICKQLIALLNASPSTKTIFITTYSSKQYSLKVLSLFRFLLSTGTNCTHALYSNIW